MLLTYTFPQFEEAILTGTKIHTLRADPTRRWKPGMSIQHWMGSPRNTRAAVKPRQFAEGECKSVQEVRLHLHPEGWFQIEVEGRFLSPQECRRLIANDGLAPDEFVAYFCAQAKAKGWSTWEGRIIHFTDFKY